MNTNDLINGAFENAPGLLQGENLYVLEVNAARNDHRIITLNDCYIDSKACFQYGINPGNAVVGIFDSVDAAEFAWESIRTLVRGRDGDPIV